MGSSVPGNASLMMQRSGGMRLAMRTTLEAIGCRLYDEGGNTKKDLGSLAALHTLCKSNAFPVELMDMTVMSKTVK